MTSAPYSHIPVAESGSGQYRCMAVQNNECMAHAKDEILKAVDLIPVQTENKSRRVFTIGDYGTANGSSSMPLIRDIISAVRKKQGEIPVHVIYEDQASSDFNKVFRRVHGLTQEPTYLTEFDKVFVMASGTNFFQQVTLDNTVDIILCFAAAHWMSEEPTTYRNSLTHIGGNETERKLAAAQAAKDWETFLVQRAKELKPGGVLVVSMGARKEGLRPGFKILLDKMAQTLKTMESEGMVTEEEFVNSNFSFYERNAKECMAPFEDKTSAVCKAGLKLMKYEEILFSNTLFKQWQNKLDKEGIDDRKTLAKEEVNKHRYWSNSSLIRGLSSTRSESEKEALVDEFFQRLEANLELHDPREFRDFNLMSHVFVQKV